eukprot:maker-scaffold_1-snap-gene-11.31-mRNA-1 protein AED:0.09 eAED:0.16 QI:0/0/0.5/1/1/1/2/296/189
MSTILGKSDLVSISDLLKHRNDDKSVLENTVDLFNSIVYLWAVLTENNPEWLKKNRRGEGFNKGAVFKWKENSGKTELLSAHEYCMKALVKIESIFEDKSFPWSVDQPLTMTIDKEIKRIWKLMFRILIIVVSNKELESRKEHYNILTTCYVFGIHWELLVISEVKLIREEVDLIHRQYIQHLESTEFC